MKTNLVIVFVSLLLSLAAAEIAARWFLPEVGDTFIVTPESVTQKYHHRPNFSTPPPPDRSKFRIMFLGDSYTLGFNATNSYPQVAGEVLNAEASSGRGVPPVQIYNMGTVSYSPSMYGAVLRDYFDVIQPNLIVLAADETDLQDDKVYSPMLVKDESGMPVSIYPRLKGVPDSLLWLARRVKLVRLSFAGIDRLKEKYAPPQNPELLDEELRFVTHWDERLGHLRPENQKHWEKAYARTLGLIEVIVRFAQSKSTPVMLLNYPHPTQVVPRFCEDYLKKYNFESGKVYDSVFHLKQQELARRMNVPYLDVSDTFRAEKEPYSLFVPCDGHYTNAGNSLMGRRLASFLLSTGLLSMPGSVKPTPAAKGL